MDQQTETTTSDKETRETEARDEETRAPGFWSWVVKVAASVGVVGMLCCVAPAVLFALGLMGGIYAISFADFFYAADGAAGAGAWALRGLAGLVGVAGIYLYNRRQNQCSIDPKRKRLNLVLATALIAVLGVAFYLSFEALTAWYFDAYIVPAQQSEFAQ